LAVKREGEVIEWEKNFSFSAAGGGVPGVGGRRPLFPVSAAWQRLFRVPG
jgi:hypothetical protein